MSSNKLYNLINKYNLKNKIKIIVVLLILFLIYRIFIESQIIPYNIIKLENIYEGFNSATTLGLNYYGNVITLQDPSNIPFLYKNTLTFTLNDVYRIDSLLFNVNSEKDIKISFLDGNGNTKNIKNSTFGNGSNSTGSPPVFSPTLATATNNNISFSIKHLTDESDLLVYTKTIILSTVDGTNFNDFLTGYAIYGGDQTLNTLDQFNNLQNNLTLSDFSVLTPSTSEETAAAVAASLAKTSALAAFANYNTITTYINTIPGQDYMIYSLLINYTYNSVTSSDITESAFNIRISYENSLYPSQKFTINNPYKIRNDYYSVDRTTGYIYLKEPILANKITFSFNSIKHQLTPAPIELNITSLRCLCIQASDTDKSNFKRDINFSNSTSGNSDTQCPSIDELVTTQDKTQKLCDNMEFQDRLKSEQTRLERNRLYLLKLKDQQVQIDKLNTVIQDLETKRQARDKTSDQVRVLQYQKQKADSSTIRDLANQRLESQANNQLYMDINVIQS